MEIKSTDRDHFRLVYYKDYGLIVRVIQNIVYNLEIAEDLAQETFQRFYEHNMRFKSEDEAKYWLISVARNLALNHARRVKRETRAIERIKSDPDIGLWRDPGEAELSDGEIKGEVMRAIDSLPPKLSSVIRLKVLDGLDYKAIGKVLGISETNVKVRVFRARKALSGILGREEGDVY